MSVLYQLIHMSVTYLYQLLFFSKKWEKKEGLNGGGVLILPEGLELAPSTSFPPSQANC